MDAMTFLDLFYFGGWILLLGVVAAGFWRIARGPTLFDRIIGFDTAMIAIVGWLVLFSIRVRTAEFLELIIVVTALGFFATVSYYYYLSQPHSESRDSDSEGEA